MQLATAAVTLFSVVFLAVGVLYPADITAPKKRLHQIKSRLLELREVHAPQPRVKGEHLCDGLRRVDAEGVPDVVVPLRPGLAQDRGWRHVVDAHEVLGQVVPGVEPIGGDIGESVELHRGAELRSSSCTCRTPSDPHCFSEP